MEKTKTNITIPVLKPKSFLRKALLLIKNRPFEVYDRVMEFSTFYFATKLSQLIFKTDRNVKLESNVRVQSIRTIKAERPYSHIKVGANTVLYNQTRINTYSKGSVQIGKNSVVCGATINSFEKIIIGDEFLCSHNVFIQDYNPHNVDSTRRRKEMQFACQSFHPSFDNSREYDQVEVIRSSNEIIIGNNVWVGMNAIILKGARIGDNCIIAAGAVVTSGDYPDNSVIAGNPAEVIRTVK